MQIPHKLLSEGALQGLLEEFVTREGTDYGQLSHSLAAKTAQVRRQLDRGEALIIFDPVAETWNIQTAEWLRSHPEHGQQQEQDGQ